ncbi:Type II site-specific deoxyribonuclease, partial [mine drainage metagenome]
SPPATPTFCSPRRNPPIYLECKTYNLDNVATTQRSFYLSPPLAKVTRDAFHLLLAFQTEKKSGRFFPTKFRLLSIEALPLDLKHEFNQNNRVLYSSCPTIAEGVP